MTNLFDHLDDYSLLDIFDHLDPVDLLNVAELSHRLQQLITHYYIDEKYHVAETGVSIYATNDYQKSLDIRFGGQMRSFNGKDVGHRIFRTFGSSFRRLNIYIFSMHLIDEIRDIDRFIREYNGNTSQEVAFYNVHQDILNEWKNSFGNITNVILSGTHVKAITGLNVIFPRLQTLTIDVDSIRNLDCLEQHFPHLKEFTLKVLHKYDNIEHFKEMIRLNPQNRKFDMSLFVNTTFLLYASEMLPHLDSFGFMTHLYCFYGLVDQSKAVIQFVNVTNLSITIGDRENGSFSLNNRQSLVRFHRLETLHLHPYGPGSIDDLITFAGESKTLTKLTIYWDLTYLQLKRIDRILPALTEITLHCVGTPVFDEIKTFLMSEIKLDRLIISFTKYEWNEQHVSESVPLHWKFQVHQVDTGKTTFIFDRINIK